MGQEALCRHNRNRQDDFALDTSHGCRSDITYKSLQNREFFSHKKPGNKKPKMSQNPGNSRNRDPGSQTLLAVFFF